MSTATYIVRHRLAFSLSLLTALVAVMQWLLRDQPFIMGPLRLDGLNLFFSFTLLLGTCLAAWHNAIRLGSRELFLALTIGLALVVRSTAAIAILYVAITLWWLLFARVSHVTSKVDLFDNDTNAGGKSSEDMQSRNPTFWRGVAKQLLIAVGYIPLVLPPVCLAIAYSALALHRGANYDDPLAGAALDSLVFWFTLLAAALPLVLVVWQGGEGKRGRGGDNSAASIFHFSSSILYAHRFSAPSPLIFFYPLVRLYTLGPWNSGWALATALFGGALALWAAWRFVTQLELVFAWAALLGLGLACLGLGTSAGVASGCFLLLAAELIGGQGSRDDRRPRNDERRPTNDDRILTADYAARSTEDADDTALLESLLHATAPGFHRSNTSWLLFAAPLVAVWTAVGAAVAGGVSALAGAAWAVLLLGGLAIVLRHAWPVSRAHLLASLGMAIAAPFVVVWLIEPVVLQLQGGLTPYGDVLIWPWIGLAFANSAQAQVAAFPSIAILLMLIVLAAIVYLLTQLRDQHTTKPNGSVDARWLWQALRDEVPWLGERHRGDAE